MNVKMSGPKRTCANAIAFGGGVARLLSLLLQIANKTV